MRTCILFIALMCAVTSFAGELPDFTQQTKNQSDEDGIGQLESGTVVLDGQLVNRPQSGPAYKSKSSTQLSNENIRYQVRIRQLERELEQLKTQLAEDMYTTDEVSEIVEEEIADAKYLSDLYSLAANVVILEATNDERTVLLQKLKQAQVFRIEHLNPDYQNDLNIVVAQYKEFLYNVPAE